MSNDPDLSIFPGASGDRSQWGACGCSRCVGAHLADQPWPFNMNHPFIVCPDCGNKRCPKAAWHDNACTGSNEPGQPGSNYPAYAAPVPHPAATDPSGGGAP